MARRRITTRKKPENDQKAMLFAEAFVETNDYAEAALAAGLTGDTRQKLYANGQRYSQKEQVREAVKLARKNALAALGIEDDSQTRLLVHRRAHFDLSAFTKADRNGLPYYDFSKATRQELGDIASFKVKIIEREIVDEETGEARIILSAEVKGHDQAKWMDMWLKMNGGYEKDNEQQGKSLAEALKQGAMRARKSLGEDDGE